MLNFYHAGLFFLFKAHYFTQNHSFQKQTQQIYTYICFMCSVMNQTANRTLTNFVLQ